MKRLSSIFWLELRNLRMFVGTQAARSVVIEAVLTLIVFVLVLLLATCFDGRGSLPR